MANKQDIQANYERTCEDIHKLREELECMRYDNQTTANYVKQNKLLVKDVMGQMGYQQQTIAQLNTLTEDLPVLVNQFKDTEFYISKILPLSTQLQIFKTTKALVTDNDQLLNLMEQTDKIINDLISSRRDNPDFQLNKRHVELPAFKQQIVDLKENLKGDYYPMYTHSDESEDEDEGYDGSPKSKKKYRFGPLELNNQ